MIVASILSPLENVMKSILDFFVHHSGSAVLIPPPPWLAQTIRDGSSLRNVSMFFWMFSLLNGMSVLNAG